MPSNSILATNQAFIETPNHLLYHILKIYIYIFLMTNVMIKNKS